MSMSLPLALSPEARRRALVALAIYVAVTVTFALTAAPERLAAHTPYNHFALLAEAWLKGRLDLGGPPPGYTGNNDFAVYGGRTYVSFPQFPAVLLVPLVALAGSAENTRDGLFFLLLAGIAPAVLFLALDKLTRIGRSQRTELENIGLALLFALGTVYWFSSIQGTVWFAAHVVGAALMAIYLYCSVEAAHPFGAGLALGLGFATRTSLGFAFPLFAYEAYCAAASIKLRKKRPSLRRFRQAEWRALFDKLLLFAIPAALVLSIVLWHNRRCFDNPFEFGHRYLSIHWRARIDKWGLFSYHYLARNLGIVLTSLPFVGGGTAPFQVNAHGLALWVTSPIYLWALWPRRTGRYFWAVALTALCVAAPAILYQNSGWVQFGYRFSNDYAPLLITLIAIAHRRLTPWFWGAAAVAVLVNAFGALSFERPAYNSYYFIDGTQKIIYQPD
jgi:hypothetical protein